MKRTIVFILALQGAFLCAQESRTGAISRGIFHQEGIASWYGAEFNGRPTASGELFNDTQFTAAHPILPFGTMIKVTSQHNNKTVTVRVNDRGPFVAARIIDLSRAAAAELDMISTGTAPVTVESLDVVSLPARPQNQGAPAQAPVQNTAPAPVQSAVQAGAPAQAPAPYAGTLPALPGETVQIRPASVEPYSSGIAVSGGNRGEPWAEPLAGTIRFQPAIPDTHTGKQYRIQVGSYKQPQHAVEAFEKLKTAGFNPAYEKYGDYYRVVLAGLRQEELKTVGERLGLAGFREALLREEK